MTSSKIPEGVLIVSEMSLKREQPTVLKEETLKKYVDPGSKFGINMLTVQLLYEHKSIEVNNLKSRTSLEHELSAEEEHIVTLYPLTGVPPESSKDCCKFKIMLVGSIS